MAMGRSPWFDYERDCEPWRHRRPERLSRVPLYRNSENDDAELMSRLELWARRKEGQQLHNITLVLPRAEAQQRLLRTAQERCPLSA